MKLIHDLLLLDFQNRENNFSDFSPVGRVERGDDVVSRASSSSGSGTDAGSSW